MSMSTTITTMVRSAIATTMSMSTTITTMVRSATATTTSMSTTITTTMMKIAPVAAMIMITIITITITITQTRYLSAVAQKRRFASTPPCWLKSWLP